jgi:ssDNA-binding Zn-finger/Zn-ribbon topoisomerase 1
MTSLERAQRKQATAASAQRMNEAREAARYAVALNKCPLCGAPLRRNLSITGWWQCSQYGAEGFRADSSKPSCSWQGFTA